MNSEELEEERIFFSSIFIGGRTKVGILLKGPNSFSLTRWSLGCIVHTQTHIPVIPRPLSLALFNQPGGDKANRSQIKRSKEETFFSHCFFKHSSKAAV